MRRILFAVILLTLLFAGSKNHVEAAIPSQGVSGSAFENHPENEALFSPFVVISLERDAEVWGDETVLDVDVGPNLYTYVRQNPWTYYDAYGLFLGYDSFGDYAKDVPNASAIHLCVAVVS